MAILALLAEAPMHGYQVIQEIAQRTGGVWRPSAGSVYPALAQLEDEGLVRAESADGRRVFSLTEAGTAYVTERGPSAMAPWDEVADTMPSSTASVLDLMRQLALALQQVVETGTEAHVARAAGVLTEARRSLYRILAEDDEPAS